MSEDLDYEAMHRLVRARYETPPTKVYGVEPYVPIDLSKLDYLGLDDEGEGDTGFAGDYEDDDYYESDEYADEATAELEEMKQRIQENMAAAKAATPRFMGVQSIEIPQSQEEAMQKYQNVLEEMKVDAGARGQATTKPEPKPPTRSGYARVTAPERETFFAPWETEGWGPEDPLDRPTDAPTTEEGLKRIGAHPSQKKTLPPMDITKRYTVADKERRAQQVAERQAAEEGTEAQSVEEAASEKTVGSSRGTGGTGGTGGGGGTDGGGPEGLGYDSPTVQTNTEIYKKYLPKELHNNPDALAETAKNAAAKNYFKLMEENNWEVKEDWGVEIDGEPWTEMIFANGETFFVSEDESQILRGHDQES